MAPPLRKNATSVYRFRNGFLYFPHSPPPPKKKLIFCWKRGRFEIAKKSLLDAEWASFKFLINRLLFEPRRRLIVNVCGPEHPYRCKRNISDFLLKNIFTSGLRGSLVCGSAATDASSMQLMGVCLRLTRWRRGQQIKAAIIRIQFPTCVIPIEKLLLKMFSSCFRFSQQFFAPRRRELLSCVFFWVQGHPN